MLTSSTGVRYALSYQLKQKTLVALSQLRPMSIGSALSYSTNWKTAQSATRWPTDSAGRANPLIRLSVCNRLHNASKSKSSSSLGTKRAA
jgi:hypothetical protein